MNEQVKDRVEVLVGVRADFADDTRRFVEVDGT